MRYTSYGTSLYNNKLIPIIKGDNLVALDNETAAYIAAGFIASAIIVDNYTGEVVYEI